MKTDAKIATRCLTMIRKRTQHEDGGVNMSPKAKRARTNYPVDRRATGAFPGVAPGPSVERLRYIIDQPQIIDEEISRRVDELRRERERLDPESEVGERAGGE